MIQVSNDDFELNIAKNGNNLCFTRLDSEEYVCGVLLLDADILVLVILEPNINLAAAI